ncbi:Rubredoxin-type Fe(Cys)4 protein [Magnetococcus marinus MC-1]|uniref:Rubredoxin n=1 Tax=Magnetococcus marinus (strain ATCC BAA-1437 / JCM 17883 / MC-1) TaxID=156889 RepID=A0L4B6_MAGMM|nr:rubredoxin [Magnetococcus marinus]ABK42809.1 Rubredoxin-type Fe(Cys)4 protein [Magnetococcus marinus MC-1]
MGVWCCMSCEYEYDEEVGSTATGIVAGTDFDTLPKDWRCPVCGLSKEHFQSEDMLRGESPIELADADDEEIEF